MAARRLRVPSRPRGRFTAPTSRTGKGYVYAGRRVSIKGENFRLEWAGAEVAAEIVAATQAACQTLARIGDDTLKRITPVDTGLLKSTTYAVVVVEGLRVIVRIGADTDYAVYVELGTYKMRARPYLRPTLDLVAARMVPTIRSEVRSRGLVA